LFSKINDIWRRVGPNYEPCLFTDRRKHGDRLENLTAAREAIHKKCGTVIAASARYETAAWGLHDQPSFLNQALQVQTFSKPHALLQGLLHVEQSLGRIREKKYGPRLIDIDILLYDDVVLDTPDLKIPHPELANRRFALTCLGRYCFRCGAPSFSKVHTAIVA
jgi:2-amino-4-hydroxy-6-hydroxymethyldihydropteridine diphosphokinase